MKNFPPKVHEDCVASSVLCGFLKEIRNGFLVCFNTAFNTLRVMENARLFFYLFFTFNWLIFVGTV